MSIFIVGSVHAYPSYHYILVWQQKYRKAVGCFLIVQDTYIAAAKLLKKAHV
jgi:hypothetical protein